MPSFPSTDKRWGFDLILTPKHAPDQGGFDQYLQITGQKCTVLRGAFDPSSCSRGGEGIDFIQVKSPPLARGMVHGAIHW